MTLALTTKKRLMIGLGPAHRPGNTEEEGPFLRVTHGASYNSRYDVDTAGVIFWRGDTRAPMQVFATGLSSRYVRDHKEREIVWRCGVDDIVPASAVCLARDIRGSAFFPYPDLQSEAIDDHHYLYAITVPRAACTYKIQQVAEKAETDHDNWRDPARFVFDPTWANANASCVWQFAEYAVHEVPGNQVLAGWRLDRRILVKEQNDERVQAGIQFMLSNKVENAAANVGLRDQASQIAQRYARFYPRRVNEFLSYWGRVQAFMTPVQGVANATARVRQLEPIVTPSDADWSQRDDGGDGGGGIQLAGGSGEERHICHTG